MLEIFSEWSYVLQAFVATLFNWFVTACGASFVLFFKTINYTILNMMLSFAAGVMLASSFFSLLSPSIELSEQLFHNGYITPTLGFLLGGLFVVGADFVLNIMLASNDNKHSKKRTILLAGAITLHNIPEGMCVGVAFACASFNIPNVTLIGAIMLSIGIGLQNFPEGVAVSLPLKGEAISSKKAFFIGQASGMVEPVAGVLAALFCISMQQALPFLLSFSAGAMVGVVVSELVPEANRYNKNLSTFFVTIGFCVMMLLDVALS